MNAYGYIRVSSSKQRDNGDSVEAQEAAIRRWCDANGYTLVRVFSDAGISGGKDTNRPNLQAALSAVCSQAGTAFVVYSMSRMSRSIRDVFKITDRIRDAKCNFVSLCEQFDTTKAIGNFMFIIMAGLSEFERQIDSERTRDVMAHKKAKGERVGRLPYGYTSQGGQMIPEPYEQRIIARIMELRRGGMSLKGIKAVLDSEDVPNRYGKANWRPNTIGAIVRREELRKMGWIEMPEQEGGE